MPGFDRMLVRPGWAIDRRAELHTTIVLVLDFQNFCVFLFFDVSIDFSVNFASSYTMTEVIGDTHEVGHSCTVQ